MKEAGLKLEATYDIRSHLILDHDKRVLKIYHCTSVLKEILTATHRDVGVRLIPRPLLLEAWNTFHEILFLPDHKSQALLEHLVDDCGFDDDIPQYELRRFEKDGGDPEITYLYFGDCMVELYEELQDPGPRNRFERYLALSTGSRDVNRKMVPGHHDGCFLCCLAGVVESRSLYFPGLCGISAVETTSLRRVIEGRPV
jgi:hypothetical protein